MDRYEEKLNRFISEEGIGGEQFLFEKPCHTVQQAAQAAGASENEFVKNICMVDAEGRLIVAIVKGEDRASTTRVGKALDAVPPRMASPEEILKLTGYPCGGVPSFGYPARFLVDPKVMESEAVYTGGGSEHALVRIPACELLRANGGTVVRIRK